MNIYSEFTTQSLLCKSPHSYCLTHLLKANATTVSNISLKMVLASHLPLLRIQFPARPHTVVYSPLVLFIMLHKLGLTFETVDETLKA